MKEYIDLFNVDYEEVNSKDKYYGCFSLREFEKVISRLKYPIILGNLSVLTKCSSASFNNDYNLKIQVVELLSKSIFSESNMDLNKFLKQLNKFDLKEKVFNLYGIEIPIKIIDTDKDDLLIVYDAHDDYVFYFYIV